MRSSSSSSEVIAGRFQVDQGPSSSDAARAPRSSACARALGLLLVLAVAMAGRCAALDFGRGVVDARPDELGVALALDGMRTGQPSLMYFAYGGGYHAPLSAFVQLWGALFWTEDLGTLLAHDPLRVFVAGRVWSALLSTGTVLLTYAIGRRVGGAATGLLAAALLACSPLAIREAHFLKADAAASFVAALSFLVLASRPRALTARAVVVGFVAGLALSTKYLLAFGAMPLVALGRDLRWSLRDGRWRSAVSALAVMLATFLALAPEWLTAPASTLSSVRTVATVHDAISQQMHDAISRQSFFAGWAADPLTYHVTVSLRSGAGLLVTLLVLPAMVRAMRRPGPMRLIAIAILAHCAVSMANPVLVARSVLPVFSGIAVLVADLVHATALRWTVRRGRIAIAVVGVLLVAEPLYQSTRLVSLLREPDTRASAADWIADNVPRRIRVATWGEPPGFPTGAPVLAGRETFQGILPARWRELNVRFVVRHTYPLPFSSEPLPPGWPRMRRVAVFDPFDGPIDDPVLEPYDAFYLPLAGFDGFVRPGPKIEIFAVDRG